MIYRNLVSGGYKGPCYAINPKYGKVGGKSCYRSLQELGKQIDLALIATPAEKASGPDQCGEFGVKAAVVYSGGVAEQGERGAVLEERVPGRGGRRNRIRLLGPNTLGVMRPQQELDATLGGEHPLRGKVGLGLPIRGRVSGYARLVRPEATGIFRRGLVGGCCGCGLRRCARLPGPDRHTQSILLYVEGIRDARRFVSGLRAAARLKPVIVIKSGRYPAGSRAAKSHTGAWVGSTEVFRAVMERAGVVQVEALDQLFAAAQVFGNPKRLAGNRVAIITNGGGPAYWPRTERWSWV